MSMLGRYDECGEIRRIGVLAIYFDNDEGSLLSRPKNGLVCFSLFSLLPSGNLLLLSKNGTT